jgi:hypothetical protein
VASGSVVSERFTLDVKMDVKPILMISVERNQNVKNAKSACAAVVSVGERGGTRTLDPMIKSHMLIVKDCYRHPRTICLSAPRPLNVGFACFSEFARRRYE